MAGLKIRHGLELADSNILKLNEHVGPLVAEDMELARRLLGRVLETVESGRPVVIDAFRHTSAWIEHLEALGFREERPFIRMRRGAKTFDDDVARQWAASGPELG